ncbi:unnamed protein product [Plutella xylostella]|uniref:(diamondback moth) hypothetical protein n=1 Tax=Plutella xylostella TaxID=51655 RepID=A0A8S4FV00_PLUXY|nr:unnamed protein product [Plutella xylostella]
MVLTDFLTETRRRWLKAFKLFKGSRSRKSQRNRVSPAAAAARSPSYSGTVDARADIDLQRFCACRASQPPLHIPDTKDSYFSSYNSYDSSSSRHSTAHSNDSAYDSARSSPAPAPVCYATVTYFNVNDSEDSSSVRTEYTLLEYEEDERREDERAQNLINESLELVSTL